MLPKLEGQVEKQARVVRGGSYNNESRNVRSAYRNRNNPDNRNNNQGFRVVLAHVFLGAHRRSQKYAAGSIYPFASRREKRRDLFRCCEDVTGFGDEIHHKKPVTVRSTYIKSPRHPGSSLWRGNLFFAGMVGAKHSQARARHESQRSMRMLRPYARFMYAEIYSWDNLLRAYHKASRGKRGHANVAAFEHHLEDHLLALQCELEAKTYQPGAYTSFYIHEPKRRLISAAPFRDRVVHHALCNLIEPEFERSFISDSYANRIGKGTHRALDRCQEFARRYKYVLQLDLEQFFPSIDHAILREILARKIPEPDVLWLIDRILASGRGVLANEYAMRYFGGDDLFAVYRPRGLPIGNLTSQFWANCLLNPFDHFVKRELQCRGYVRYVDDMLLFGNSRQILRAWHAATVERLAQFRLTIHTNAAQVKPVRHGIPFLGFVVYPTHRLLKRRQGIAFLRRLRAARRSIAAEPMVAGKLDPMVRGWVNHVRHGDTWRLRVAVLRRLADLKGF